MAEWLLYTLAAYRSAIQTLSCLNRLEIASRCSILKLNPTTHVQSGQTLELLDSDEQDHPNDAHRYHKRSRRPPEWLLRTVNPGRILFEEGDSEMQMELCNSPLHGDMWTLVSHARCTLTLTLTDFMIY